MYFVLGLGLLLKKATFNLRFYFVTTKERAACDDIRRSGYKHGSFAALLVFCSLLKSCLPEHPEAALRGPRASHVWREWLLRLRH